MDLQSTPTKLRSVTAVTLSYNVPDKLVRCAQSLVLQPDINEYIVIENHSTVDMAWAYEQIREICAAANVRWVFYRPETAFNFSEGQNWGLDHATNDLVLLMNNDAYFLYKDTLKSSIDLISTTTKLVGHKILNEDRSVNHFGIFWDSQLNGGHLASGFNHTDPRIETPRQFAAVTAACVLVSRTDIRFDPAYWFDLEDVDFCLQHRRRGYSVICNSYCDIVHEESSTRGVVQRIDPEWVRKQIVGRELFVSRWRWMIVRQWVQLPAVWPLFGRHLKPHYTQVVADIIGVFLTIGFGLAILGPSGFGIIFGQTLLLIAGFLLIKSGLVALLQRVF